MKKLYKKGKIHPSSVAPIISDRLAFLPATILTLTIALSLEDREVLAYLISCSHSPGTFSGGRKNNPNPKIGGGGSGGGGGGGSGGGGVDHPPLFNCDCFRCYTSYWVRWDSSPNRQLIHEIIDAFEDELSKKQRNLKNKKERKKKVVMGDVKKVEEISGNEEIIELESVEIGGGGGGDASGGGGEKNNGLEKSTLGKFVSFIGEKLWGT